MKHLYKYKKIITPMKFKRKHFDANNITNDDTFLQIF